MPLFPQNSRSKFNRLAWIRSIGAKWMKPPFQPRFIILQQLQIKPITKCKINFHEKCICSLCEKYSVVWWWHREKTRRRFSDRRPIHKLASFRSLGDRISSEKLGSKVKESRNCDSAGGGKERKADDSGWVTNHAP